MEFKETIKLIECEMKRIYKDNNGFYYEECDPEGPSTTSKNYKLYLTLKKELEQLKNIKIEKE